MVMGRRQSTTLSAQHLVGGSIINNIAWIYRIKTTASNNSTNTQYNNIIQQYSKNIAWWRKEASVMNASSSCEWRKAFKTIHGRSPRKGADFELISVNKVGRNQSHNIAGKAPAKYKRFVKLKRSSDDCTNLVPCKKKCDSPPAEVKVEDITKPLTGECDRLMLPNSDVFHHQEKLSENSSSSPSKKIQGKVIIESPRKIPLLRRTNANLFVDHLLAEDEQEPDIDEEQNVELMQEEWKDELTGCADQQSSSQNVNSVNSLKRLKSEASNNNGKKRQRNKSSLTSERNFVRLNIRRKIFAKKYSNAQKKRKFYRNKKFR